jgi:DNA (cytosine-5)-methyltransferase 1
MHSEQSEITTWEQFSKRNARSMQPTNWENFPTQSPICSGDDGLPTELDGITFSKWLNESIKAYGNAVVPQVVYQLFKTIELMHDNSFTNHD